MSDAAAPPSVPIDSDAVLKGFGQASETTLLLGEALKLFLANQREGVLNPYEDIAEEDAFALCKHPESLPEYLRRFIFWQKNILKLDSEETAKTQIPKGFKTKYGVKGLRLAGMATDTERRSAIEQYHEEQEHYFQRFHEVLAILEAAEDRFITIEDVLLRAESADAAIGARVQDQKNALEEIRKKLCSIRSILEDEVLPDIISFEHAPEVAKSLMIDLSTINIALREAIRQHHLEEDRA